MSILSDIKPKFTTADDFFVVIAGIININAIDCCDFKAAVGDVVDMTGDVAIDSETIRLYFKRIFTEHTYMEDPFDRSHIVSTIETCIIPLMMKVCDVDRNLIQTVVETSHMEDRRSALTTSMSVKYSPYISMVEVNAKISKNYIKSVRFRFVPDEDKIMAWESSLLHRNQM